MTTQPLLSPRLKPKLFLYHFGSSNLSPPAHPRKVACVLTWSSGKVCFWGFPGFCGLASPRTRSGRLIGHCRSDQWRIALASVNRTRLRVVALGFPDEEVPFGVALGHLVIPFTYGCAMAEAVCPHLLMPDAPQQLISWRNSCRIRSRYPARICRTRVCFERH